MNDITQRVGENINTILCLALQDKYAYVDLLHDNQFDVLPESGIRGRGLASVGGRVLEYQTALSVQAENDYDRMEIIKKQCLKMKSAWTKKPARKIPEIPEKPVWSQFEMLDEFERLSCSKDYLPVGYDLSNASVYGIPLHDIYCYLIWGGKRSGKTNYLKVCLQSALKKEAHICVFDDPQGTLRNYREDERIRYIEPDEDEMYAYFCELLPEFKRRNQIKNQMLAQDMDEEEIYDRMKEEIPYFIFISSLRWFVPFIYNATKDMRGFLENIIGKGRLHNIYFMSEMDVSDINEVAGYTIYELFAGYRTGIHFGGKVVDNPVVTFEYIPFLEQSKGEKPGIGQIPDPVEEQDTKKVVVPLARR